MQCGTAPTSWKGRSTLTKDKSHKLRKIDRKFSKHQNRTSGRNSFGGCLSVLLPVGALFVWLVS